MLAVLDYKLENLMSVAGASIGIVISGAILLQGFHNKYGDILENYRDLTQEYRGNSSSDPRRGSLRAQITNYRRRSNLINTASILMTLALLLYLITITVASLSVVFPDVGMLRMLGLAGLIGGLVLIMIAVCLDLLATILARHIINKEVTDFNDLPQPTVFSLEE